MKLKKELIPFFIVIGYVLVFYCFQLFLYKIGELNAIPGNVNIVKWDANWYKSIAENGYSYNTNAACNSGFFFLMPVIWKFLHVGGFGMAMVNVVFFAIGFSVICKIYSMRVVDQLVWLSGPSLFFLFIPYSEALFFLLVSLSFYGILNRKYWLVFICLFLVSLTRASALFLIPSFIIMELLSNERKQWLISLKDSFLIYIIPLLLGTAFFIWYQHNQTGVWFGYFLTQSTAWGHVLAWPVLPYQSADGPRLVWLNALAVFADLIAFVFLMVHFYRWLFKNLRSDKLAILSFCYLVAAFLMITFMSPSWGGATNAAGMHRYSLVTPFFLVFYNYISSGSFYKARHFILAFLIANASFLMFGSYKHILFLLYFNFVFIIVVFYMLNANKKLSWPAMALFGINLYLQINLLQQFIADLPCD